MTHQFKTDTVLQESLIEIDESLRRQLQISEQQRAVGLLDLRSGRLAMLDPDRIEYAASVAKIGILYAWFKLHPEAVTNLAPQTRHELALMVKASSNEMAAKFSQQIGLARLQEILNSDGFYDPGAGGGIWVGKHYGIVGERIPDPIGGNSHAATVRQLLRFYHLLATDRLISRDASRVMREIFAAPDIPHDNIKFVKGLQGRDRQILRKWGSWENWLHDTAIIRGGNTHYILVALTSHAAGDTYLEGLAAKVDDHLNHPAR